MATRIERAPAEWWGMSALAGLIGGAFMALYEMLYFLSTYGVFWLPMNMVGAIIPGFRPPLPTFNAGPTLTGICLHLILAAVWGLIYGVVVAALFPLAARTWRGAVLLGLGWGTVVWAAMALMLSQIVLPYFYIVENPAMLWIGNLVYGVASALFLYALERRHRVVVTFFPELTEAEAREPERWI
ncbi:MAG TPA: hypothetical protein V6D47_04665 [Oscillatoriaceae cyanobacterium]